MKIKVVLKTFTPLFIAGVMTVVSANNAQSQQTISLPAPQTGGGKPLMQALKDRETNRTFAERKFSQQLLSNLLWAACGINRPDSGKRTAPTAMNRQEIDVYVAMEQGLYLYDAKKHSLNLVVRKDLREMTGKQPFVKKAPVNLVYVADYSRMGGNETEKLFYSGTDTGFVSQNVYLFCASEGLATVVRGYVDRDRLAKEMNLKSSQKITLAQTVGYSK